MSKRRNIIREAIAVALEGGPSGDLHAFVVLAKQQDALRLHVLNFVLDFGHYRGVALEESDVIYEIDCVIAELRGAPKPARILDESTITDAQIRALGLDADVAIRRLCKVALNDAPTYLKAAVVRDARGRCAEILNARAKEKNDAV